MLIAPAVALGYGPGPCCEVCKTGSACAVVLHARGHFLVCSACCGNVAAELVVRVAFAQNVAELERFYFERLA